MKEIDKIAFIETENGQILSTKSKGKSKYYIPGGKRELGETDEQNIRFILISILIFC
jgi:8-oxo-dGTP diphosphatase